MPLPEVLIPELSCRLISNKGSECVSPPFLKLVSFKKSSMFGPCLSVTNALAPVVKKLVSTPAASGRFCWGVDALIVCCAYILIFALPGAKLISSGSTNETVNFPFATLTSPEYKIFSCALKFAAAVAGSFLSVVRVVCLS